MTSEERYWAVDLPGLSQEDAAQVIRIARQLNITGPSALDPKTFLTLSLDRETAARLAAALRRAEQIEETVPAILEELEAWLSYSDPSREP